MAEREPASGVRYTAFISYSHKDEAHARWLHRKLESYRIPRRLAGSQGEHGPIPSRLTPIFRDRDELPAAGDLSETVRAALAASDNLIVICSPHAAASLWVAREIEVFRELHPRRAIFSAIVAGEPQDCLPPSLVSAAAGGNRIEPLAADLRPGRDGRRLGLLKLVAGLAGVGLDALVQRDSARRVRRVMAVTAAALAAVIIMAVLTILAMNARLEAERQRAEAEGLIEFMLTDLRQRLKGVGRLEVLASANRRALDYYSEQDLATIPADALARRARVLHAMGEDEQARGELASAAANFTEAYRTTTALLMDRPRNPEIIYAHAQSEFWMGALAWQRNDLNSAEASFSRYAELAERLARIAPRDVRSLREVGYATGNLCTLNQQLGRESGLLTLCRRALVAMTAASKLKPEDTGILRDVANRHAWLADAYRELGKLQDAREERQNERRIIERLLSDDPHNAIWKRARIWSDRALADLDSKQGRSADAWVRLSRATRSLETMTAADPNNRELRDELEHMRGELDLMVAGSMSK